MRARLVLPLLALVLLTTTTLQAQNQLNQLARVAVSNDQKSRGRDCSTAGAGAGRIAGDVRDAFDCDQSTDLRPAVA